MVSKLRSKRFSTVIRQAAIEAIVDKIYEAKEREAWGDVRAYKDMLDVLYNDEATIKIEWDDPEPEDEDHDEEDQGPTAQDLTRDALLKALDDNPNYEYTADELVGEVIAHHGDIATRDTLKTYIYEAIKDLKQEDHIIKVGRGKYMAATDYDLNEAIHEDLELNKAVIGDNPHSTGGD